MELDIDGSLDKIKNLFKHMDFEKLGNDIPKGEPVAQHKIPPPKINRAYETVINVLGSNFFNIEFDGNKIEITDKSNINADQEYPVLISSLIEYMIDQGCKILPLPEIKLIKDPDESRNFFGKTAYYNPQENEIVLFVLGRHKKDVVRSFSHEMVHHMQNLQGRLNDIATTNTNEDGYLLELEKEAYLEGNILFRNWEDKVKNE